MSTKQLIKRTILLMPPLQRKRGMWVIGLMVFNGLLDFFSIAAFIPLLAAVVEPDFVSNNAVTKKIYSGFGFASHPSFVVAITTAVLLFVILKNVISLWIAKVKARYAFNIRNDLSSRGLVACMHSSFLEFTKRDYTRELHKITSHPLAFANNIILSMATIISEVCVGIFILTCVMLYDYEALLLVAMVLFPLLLLFRMQKSSLKKISNELRSTYPVVLKYSNQAIEGFIDIVSYQKASFFYQRFQKVSKRLTETFILDQTNQAGTLRLTEIILAFAMCSLVIYSVATALPYQQTLVLLGVYAGAGFRIMPSMNRILYSIQQIRTNEHALEELNIPREVSIPSSSDMNLEFNETIELRNISFQYHEGPKALNNVSLKILKGQKVAITGTSGEGKTTLLLILLGFLPNTQGEILLDGQPVSDKNAWHKLIGYVPQNPYILDGTVAENIAFGVPAENIDKAKIRQLVHDLALDELIRQLPDGIDTQIGERGIKISGGQRQRLAIARALYADREILILDEVTNQVHNTLELEIMNLLNALADQNKTIIMVTHKISESRFFDTILRLGKGKLHEILIHA